MRGALLWREADGGWQRGQSSNVEATDVHNVLAESGGTVWLGTAAGLHELRGNEIVPVARGELAIDRPVYLIVQDGRRTWFGTDDGVEVWDGERLRHLGVRHGRAGRETAGARRREEGGVAHSWSRIDGSASRADPQDS